MGPKMCLYPLPNYGFLWAVKHRQKKDESSTVSEIQKSSSQTLEIYSQTLETIVFFGFFEQISADRFLVLTCIVHPLSLDHDEKQVFSAVVSWLEDPKVKWVKGP